MLALWLAARDRRTPRAAKIVAALVATYALSPIDLIPDFVPVLGLLDDLVLVPAGIWLAVRLIPAELMADFRNKAADLLIRPRSTTGAVLIVLLWLALLIGTGWLLWH